jgi:hypothetical protein
LPTSCWYIVNQFFSTDPDLRHPPLEDRQEVVGLFEQIGGLVIDTRELFQLVRAVDASRMTPADARRKLRSSTGIFKFDFDLPKTSAELVSAGAINVSEWPLYTSPDAEAGSMSPFVERDGLV